MPSRADTKPLRIFTNRSFAKFARKNRISPEELRIATDRLVNGSIDADLGGGVYKQRIARTGKGKSGGYRTILVCNLKSFSLFLHGFAKKDKDNITLFELREVKRFAKEIYHYDDEKLDEAVRSGEFFEVSSEANIPQ